MKIPVTALALLLALVPAQAGDFIMPGERGHPGDKASLTRANQILRGGAIAVSVCALGNGIPATGAPTNSNMCVGSFTLNCGWGPLQTIFNNGAFTITAPLTPFAGAGFVGNEGSCIVKVINQGSAAAAPTFSGFTVKANPGDPFTSTNLSIFYISFWCIRGHCGYNNTAAQ